MGGPGSGRRPGGASKVGGGKHGMGGIQKTPTGRIRKGTGKGRVTSSADHRIVKQNNTSTRTLNHASKVMGMPVKNMTKSYKNWLGSASGKATIRGLKK